MDDTMIARHLENLDLRLARVEQFLPTLATKEELQTAIAPLATKEELQAAIAPLATKAELRLAIAEAIAPLATKDDLGELRRHMEILHEHQRGDIQLLAEHLSVAMSKLADKRVGIIGTGATSVQCVPHLARACRELYVFQRTPSSVDARGNGPLDPQWFSTVATPGWQQRWLENFTANQAGGGADVDLVQDGWTDLARRIREKIQTLPKEARTLENMRAAFEAADFEKMDEIRGRADAIVDDYQTAQKLKAWYRQLCKRPCFHDTYLQSFNTPGTVLVDTDGQGVERITASGVVAAGKTYDLDCLIFASGFEVGTAYVSRAGFDLIGRDGRKLSDYWAQGMRSKHGIHVHGFPNAFFVQPTQGANLISNVPHNLTDSGKTIAVLVKHALAKGCAEIEVTSDAEDAWVALLLTSVGRMAGGPDCTPGYYNNEGREPGPAAKLNVGYPDGAKAYFKYIDDWRASGDYAGVEFR